MGVVADTHCTVLHVVPEAACGGVGREAWHLRLQHPDVLIWGSGAPQMSLLMLGESEGT